MKLTKIGPGLDPRLNLWQKVYVWFSAAQMEPLTDLEKDALRRLANGVSWVELVPEEWRNIYGAIYDEYDTIIIEEKEKTKIDKDVPRTFTLFARYTRQLRIVFPEDLTEYYQALTKVLQLASIGRGYCQGVNFIAAKLLFELADEKEAFIVLSFLLKNCQLEILFDSRYSALFDYMRIFEKKLRTFNNKLYKHLKKCEFRSSSYAIEWFTTCFIVTCPGEICLCVIDMILSGINDIMIRMGLALLHTLEHRLLRLDFEKLHESFKDYCMKSDTVYVIVQALKIQFQVDNSVLKAMARKIESLDPGSGGDLRFGKPKKLETPKSNVRGPKFRKNRNKTSTPVTLPSDDSLSEEGEIESEPQLNDESELKPIQLVLKAPVLEESLPDGIDPDSSSPVAQAEEEDNHRNSKSRRRISKLTIKISPKRLNQWKQLRTEKPSPEQTESVTAVSEDVEEGSMSPVTDIHLEKQLMEQFSENYDSEIQSTQSVFKDGTNPTSTKSSSDKSPTEVSSAKSPSWWHWPSFRSGKSPGDSSASTSNRQTNGQASTKASFSAPTVSTTNSSCPSPLNRRDFRYGSFKGDIDSEVINRKIPPPTSRLFRRRRVLEKFCIDSMEEEEEIIREFYLTDNHDSLLLLHYLPICFAMESIDEGDAPPLSGSRKGSVASNHSPSKDSPSKGLRRLSFLRRFRTSSDLSQPEEKVDVVNIDPSHIRSENEEYIDQGGEVISPNFYRTNHLISEILHSNHRLLENYFEIKEKERERKIIRTSKQGSSPRIRSGKGKSNKVHKTASSNNGIGPTNGHRGIRIKATKFDSLHDSEILQNAMYYSFSQALYK